MAIATRYRILTITLFWLLIPWSAGAIPPDFNADRRVHIKCPSTIDRDFAGQFELDGLQNTLRRLFHTLEENLQASARGSAENVSGYSFSPDPGSGRFYVCHVKAVFPPDGLATLSPQEQLEFQEVFFVTDIDWETNRVVLSRQRDGQRFTIGVADFEQAFLWYNALIDKHRAYVPVYGFLSLPGEAESFPTIWNSYQAHRTDTATPPESLVDYDFYKILDYRDGYYLLGKDFNELDYRQNAEDFGIIGWVEKKYITLWRSRLYYHPRREVSFYDSPAAADPAPESDEINAFYVRHEYLKERLFNDIVEKLDQESLHKFYTHFGFPQLTHPQDSPGGQQTKVFVSGAFTPRLMRMLGSRLKQNLNVFFLLDVSESMRPFADFIDAFNHAVTEMQPEGVALRVNRTFTYSDSGRSDRDPSAALRYGRVNKRENLRFVQQSNDRNYSEPLMRAILRTQNQIRAMQEKRQILPLQEKLLFIITDAGPNDFDARRFEQTVSLCRDLNLRVYFVYPDKPGKHMAGPGMDDTPQHSYQQLEGLLSRYERDQQTNGEIRFRRFRFESEHLGSSEQRRSAFLAEQKRLLDGITTYLDHVFAAGGGGLPRDVILYFSDERLLTRMRQWSDRKIQVLNHVVKYVRGIDRPSLWEERIAIPSRPVEAYLRAVRTQDDVSLSDLKKLVIINSLVSVDDVEKCRRLYDHVKPLIERKTFRSADAVFYQALTGREPGPETPWNRALGEDRNGLAHFLAERGFHLNAFNQAVQRKFMYLRVGELYQIEN